VSEGSSESESVGETQPAISIPMNKMGRNRVSIVRNTKNIEANETSTLKALH